MQNGELDTYLNNATGCARAARILAIIGPSGSGKSTLLTWHSGRLNHKLNLDKRISRIYLNDQLIDDQRLLLAHCGYVESPTEFGIFIGSLTVREHLTYQVKPIAHLYQHHNHQCSRALGHAANAEQYSNI